MGCNGIPTGIVAATPFEALAECWQTTTGVRMLRRNGLVHFLFALVVVYLPTAHAAFQQPDCAQVCNDMRGRIKKNALQFDQEYKQWQERLGLKSDIVRLDQGYSAAEELLRFMSSYYRRHAPGQQMEPPFLVYVMSKCFPEAYIDNSRARMSGLVATVWAAEHLKIERKINTCK